MKKSHKKVLADLAELHDRNLLRLLKKGTKTVLNQKGEPVEVDLTAAELNAVTARLKACGVTIPSLEGSAIDEITQEIKDRGLKLADHLPPISEADDIATKTA